MHFVPNRGTLQRRFDAPVELALRQFFVKPDAKSNILIYRHRKRSRLLEHHADAGAQQIEILLRIENVLAVEQNFAFGALARIKIIHPVQHAQQGGLAAARRADQCRHLVGVERQVDVLQRQIVAVEEAAGL